MKNTILLFLFVVLTSTHLYAQNSDYVLTRSMHRIELEQYAEALNNFDGGNPLSIPVGIEVHNNEYSCKPKEGQFGVKLWYDRKGRTLAQNWKYEIEVSLVKRVNNAGIIIYMPISEKKILQIDDRLNDENLQTYIHRFTFEKNATGGDFDINDHQDAILYIKKIEISPNAPDDIYLDMEYFKNGQDELLIDYNLKFGSNVQNDQLQLVWDYLPGAEEYDLEWVYIDKYSNFSTTYPNPTKEDPFTYQEPTRITTTDQHFVLEMNYPEGVVYFRVRGVGHYEDYPEQPRYTPWHYGIENPVKFEIEEAYEGNKIWQSVTTYAEEGKYKKVISYLDGSMRSRQVVTHLNTDNLALVAETRYDYEGRGVVQILPVPLEKEDNEMVASLHYRNKLNQFTGGDQKSVYDNGQMSLAQLSTDSGVGQYYSSNNTLNTIHRDYLPNANGYAFTQVVYDNEGRVKSQGGVGELFQYDTENNDRRSTEYFYANTNETELRRMFGTNVGKSSHYRKQAVRDANGQVSVSYMDQAGNVIATALAGESPQMLIALDKDADENLNSINVSLDANNRIDLENHTSISTNEILNVTPNTLYTINYKMGGEDAQIIFEGDTYCENCKYTLNVYIYTPSEEKISLVENQEIGGEDCTTLPRGEFAFEEKVVFKKIGTYTLIKELTLNKDAIEEIRRRIEQSDEFQTLSNTIIQEYIDNIDETNCVICVEEECLDDITNIDDWSTNLQQVRCQNIEAQIRDWVNEEPSRRTMQDHPEYCHLQDCNANATSTIYSQKMSLIKNWTEAVQQGYARPLDIPIAPTTTTLNYDPYFTNSDCYGYGSLAAMQQLLSNVATDPTTGNPINAWQAALAAATQQTSVVNIPIDELRWQFFYGYYTQAKNTLHRTILTARGCFYGTYINENGETVEIMDPIVIDPVLPTTPQEQNDFFNENFPPLNCQQQVATWMEQIYALCNDLTDTQKADIQTNLEAYCAITNDGGNAYGFLYYEDCADETGRTASISSKINPTIAQNLKTDSKTQELIKSIQKDKQKLDNQTQRFGDPFGGGGLNPIDPIKGGGGELSPELNECLCQASKDAEFQAVINGQIVTGYGNPDSFIQNCKDYEGYSELMQCVALEKLKDYDPIKGGPVRITRWSDLAACGWTCEPTTPQQQPSCICELTEQYNGMIPIKIAMQCFEANRDYFIATYGGDGKLETYIQNCGRTIIPIVQNDILNIAALEQCLNTSFGCTIDLTTPDCVCELYQKQYATQEELIECYEMNPAYFNSLVVSLKELKACVASAGPNADGLYDVHYIIDECLKISIDCQTKPTGSLCDLGYAATVAEIKAILGYTQKPTDNSDNAKMARCIWYFDDNQTISLAQLEECAGVVLDCNQGTGCNTSGNQYLDNIRDILDATPCTTTFEQIVVENPCKKYITHERTSQKQYSVLERPNYNFDINNGPLVTTSSTMQVPMSDKYKVFGQGDFTLEAYVTLKQPIGPSRNLNIMYMINPEDGHSVDYSEKAIFWNVDGNNHQVNFWFPGGRVHTTTSINIDECTHIAVVRKNGEINIYFNGVLQSKIHTYFLHQEELNQAINFSTTKKRRISIGTHSFFGTVQHAGGHFPGVIREVRIWNEAKVPTSFTSPDELVINDANTLPNLLGYWRINEGYGTLINDYSANPIPAILSSVDRPATPSSSTWQEPTECAITGPFTQTIRVCNEYDQTVLDAIFPTFPTLAELEQKCKDELREIATLQAKEELQRILDQKQEEFLQEYYAKCFEGEFNEKLNYQYTPSEYHYTLFYYDQAGSLVQTVPPKGVQLLSVAEAQAGNINPNHRMRTRYRYNSLGQVRWQDSPDGGTSTFVYDDLGHPRLSQNAEQALHGQYSYTKFDNESRTIETGQLKTTKTLAQLKTEMNHPNTGATFPSLGYEKTEIIRMFYDFTPETDDPSIEQTYLRGRIAATVVQEDGETMGARSLYSYDIHGNVDQLWQQLPELQETKLLTYKYGLVTGNVNEVNYQKGKTDEFSHRYYYDADNRVTTVETSHDGYIWDEDASYQYYAHSSAAHTEIGEYKVQAMDYTYTLHGWIKGVNQFEESPTTTEKYKYISQKTASYALHYYKGEYQSIGGHSWTANNTTDLYNANVAAMSTDLSQLGNLTRTYRYDQLNRLRESNNEDGTLGYKETFSYDANGNILTNTLHNKAGMQIDNAIYNYIDATNKNLLGHISDPQHGEHHAGFDLMHQTAGNFDYDAIGSLIKDETAEVEKIEWTAYRKRKKVVKEDGTTITYRYDITNKRIYKKVEKPNGETQITHYVKDASGNTIAIYTDEAIEEFTISIGSQIGIYNGKTEQGKQTLGNKKYHFNNHLGNSLSIFTDNKFGKDNDSDQKADIYSAFVIAQRDYLSFGAIIIGRSFENQEYRYSFNGKELDKDTGWQDYGFRDYNPVYKRFDMVDPLSAKYPELTPYQFASNIPISSIDFDGLESAAAVFYGSAGGRLPTKIGGAGLKVTGGVGVVAIITDDGLKWVAFRTLAISFSYGVPMTAQAEAGVLISWSVQNSSVEETMGGAFGFSAGDMTVSLSTAGNVINSQVVKKIEVGGGEAFSVDYAHDSPITQVFDSKEAVADWLKSELETFPENFDIPGAVMQTLNSIEAKAKGLAFFNKTGNYELQRGDLNSMSGTLAHVAEMLNYPGVYSMLKANGINQQFYNEVAAKERKALLGYDGTPGGGRGNILKGRHKAMKAWKSFTDLFGDSEEKEAEEWFKTSGKDDVDYHGEKGTSN